MPLKDTATFPFSRFTDEEIKAIFDAGERGEPLPEPQWVIDWFKGRWPDKLLHGTAVTRDCPANDGG